MFTLIEAWIVSMIEVQGLNVHYVDIVSCFTLFHRIIPSQTLRKKWFYVQPMIQHFK